MVSGNPQRNVSQAIVGKGAVALVAYLREKLPEDYVPPDLFPGEASGGPPSAKQSAAANERAATESAIVGIDAKIAVLESKMAEATCTTATKHATKKEIAKQRAARIKVRALAGMAEAEGGK